MSAFNIAPVDSAWKTLCKILFGKEVGGLRDFEPYLKEAMIPTMIAKSSVSGKDVFLTNHLYQKGARFIAPDEIDAAKAKTKPVSVNDIKDIDSLFRAGAENMVYCGNKAFGRNANVGQVDNVIDCIDVYYACSVRNVKKSAYISCARESEYIFGGYLRILDSEFCINCYEIVEAKRCFEVDSSSRCSNCYFSHNLEGCEECILCCNAKGLHYAVFNKQLPKEEYFRVKKMLLDYVNAELGKKKKVGQSIFSLMAKG